MFDLVITIITIICFQSDTSHRGHVINVQAKNVIKQMNGILGDMVPELDEFIKRLRTELIRPTERNNCQFPGANDRSASESPSSDLRMSDKRYAKKKKKKSISLYAACLKNNFEKNCSKMD